MALLLHVRINTPEKLIWEGDAESVSSFNAKGPFDILPMHANFISIVEDKPIKITSGGTTKDYTFNRSVIYTHANKVYIYTNL